MGANRRRKSPSPRPSPATLRNGSTAHRRAAPAAPDQFGSRGWWTRPCCCRRRLAAPHWPSQASSVDGLERSRSFHWDIGHAPPSPPVDDIQHRQGLGEIVSEPLMKVLLR
ncbi:uncharacterized protein LOC125545790 isoform X2 [Triticum urartu]|uniref:uncharacterized protein LOC125545790 isoform X2 n=1 Tax=Triticum urartu TaxID=4572 RepID=UPI002042CD9E|nr:uncharacterized protein LOC125545790 isoform X2 [Triticum urartu]